MSQTGDNINEADDRGVNLIQNRLLGIYVNVFK